MKSGREVERMGRRPVARRPRGIVINRGAAPTREAPPPRIAAFIWGGKVRPPATLAYGRWKGAA